MKILLVTFLLNGLLFSAIALPLALRKVPPNSLYGFRVKKTLSDESTWYRVNEFFGWRFFWLGWALALLAVACMMWPAMTPWAATLLCCVGLVAGVIGVILWTLRFLSSISS